MNSGLQLVVDHLPELWLRLGEHILLTAAATLAAIAGGVPLGILASRHPWLRGPILGGVGILQTVPSLAMLAFLLALTGRIGTPPALIALVLYALLPIVRNTLTGLTALPPATLEAADGIGMTRSQRLWLIELPLATPVIVAGIRTAAVVGVGIATLSAFIGAGGLGQFINRGLSLSNNTLILLGAIPSALLALLADASIAGLQWGLRRRRSPFRPRWLERTARAAALSTPALLLAAGILSIFGPAAGPAVPEGDTGRSSGIVRIGSKNFTEQLILGEVLAQLIEGTTDLAVERHFNLGGTMITHGALVAGDIDLYPEYTGTALTAVLQADVISDPDQAYAFVSQEYRRRFALVWLEPLGFNNTYAITLRAQEAAEAGLKTISDLQPLASRLRAGWTSEFSGRQDGYPGLVQRYGFEFGSVRDLDASLMYEALARNEVDVISAFATDGRIAAYELQPLEDNLHFFPPYFAAPVLRAATMQQLNAEVDQAGRLPAEVAREFLQREKLLVSGRAPGGP